MVEGYFRDLGMEKGISKPKLATILLIIALTASSLMLIESASGVTSVTRLAAPKFSVKYIDNSYDVPPTTTMDPYKGQTITEEYQVINKSIEITIENPLSSNYGAYYSVRAKGHFEENWINAFDILYLPQTLVITFSSTREGYYYSSNPKSKLVYAPLDCQVDFQVKAIKGHTYQVPAPYVPFPRTPEYLTNFKVDAESDWSETQTVTIPNASYTLIPANPSPTTSTPASTYPPTLSATPIQNSTSTLTQIVIQTDIALGLNWEQTIIALIGVIIVALVVPSLFYRRRAVGKTHKEAD